MIIIYLCGKCEQPFRSRKACIRHEKECTRTCDNCAACHTGLCSALHKEYNRHSVACQHWLPKLDKEREEEC